MHRISCLPLRGAGRPFRLRAWWLAVLLIVLVGATRAGVAQEAGDVTDVTVVSDRVGGRISLRARDYFGLFTDIDGFTSAVVRPAGPDSVEFRIMRDHGGDTGIIAPRAIVQELRTYIGSFETLFEGEPAMLDWVLLSRVTRPSSPFVNDPITLTLTTRRGRVLQGIVVFADDSVLAMAPAPRGRSRGRTVEGLEIFSPSEIVRVSDGRGSLAHLFSEVDIPVERNDTIYRRYVLPFVRGRALFYPTPSPEIGALIDAKEKRQAPAPLPPGTTADFEARLAPSRFHFGAFFGSFLSTEPAPYQVEATNGSISSYEITPPNGSFAVVTAEYGISRRLRCGLAVWDHSRKEWPGEAPSDFETFYGTSIAATGRFMAVRREPMLSTFVKRFEVSAGAGVVHQSVTVDWALGSPFSTDYAVPYTEHRSIFGATIFGGLSYYFRDYLSLEVEGRFTSFPSFDVERRESKSLSPVILLRAHPAHSITIAYSDVLAGLRFHF